VRSTVHRCIDALWTPELKTCDHPETVERPYRDLHTCTLMPPTVDRMLEAVGKSVLGVEVQWSISA
jgi:hypothetical protein